MSPCLSRLLTFLTLVILTVNSMVCSGIDDVVGSLVSELNYLRGRGLDVSNLTVKLNEAIKSYYKGDINLTIKLVDEVRSEINMLKDIAESTYIRITISKYITIALLLLAPILTYFLLPTAYAYVWYYLRRRWVVSDTR